MSKCVWGEWEGVIKRVRDRVRGSVRDGLSESFSLSVSDEEYVTVCNSERLRV